MNHSLLALGIAVFLVSLYNNVRAAAILVRVILIPLSERSPIGATAILMQNPLKERGFIRYMLTGLLCFATSVFVLTMALSPSR
jgi:hypothetical protein